MRYFLYWLIILSGLFACKPRSSTKEKKEGMVADSFLLAFPGMEVSGDTLIMDSVYIAKKASVKGFRVKNKTGNAYKLADSLQAWKIISLGKVDVDTAYAILLLLRDDTYFERNQYIWLYKKDTREVKDVLLLSRKFSDPSVEIQIIPGIVRSPDGLRLVQYAKYCEITDYEYDIKECTDSIWVYRLHNEISEVSRTAIGIQPF